MTGKERLETALNHREPDRVPFDLGSMPFTGIVKVAYRAYDAYKGLGLGEPDTQDVKQQLARCDPRLLDLLDVDTRPVSRGRLAKQHAALAVVDGYERFDDEWSFGWRRPVPHGLYFDLDHHPLARYEDLESLRAWQPPDPRAAARFNGLVDEVDRIVAQGKAVVLGGMCAGIWEMALWLRGYDQFLLDMAADPELADHLIGTMCDLKLAYWEEALKRVGPHVSVCYEADDLAAQEAPIVSPAMYRRLVKPHQKRLFSGIKSFAPHVKLAYHTDGAVWSLLPDLIELGVNAVNPVQVNAAGMGDTAALKREFGRDLCFWGAGCDSQTVLPFGTPQQVREEVKRRVGDLAPGGGYVFAGVHNIQADVPPANLDAMWSTFREEAGY
jgi:uroporphyrinogen decarboxylase